MKKIVILIAALACGLTARAQQAPWSLQDCINYALEHNLTVQQSALTVEQREVELSTAQGRRLPQVSASASESLSFGRGLTADNTYSNSNTTSTSFNLGGSVPIFQGFDITNGIKVSKLNLAAATADLEKARDDIRVAVAQAYVQILYNKEILAVAERQIEIDSLQVERLEALLSNGKAASAEVSMQKATLAQSRMTAVQASNNLELARLELTQLLELPTPEGFDVAEPAYGALRLLPRSPEAVYETAVGIKPSVRAEELRLDYAERNISLAKSGYLPTLSLSGGIGTNYYYTSGYPANAFFDQLSNNFSPYVGLSLNIPIFSRMQNRNQVKSARLSYNSQQLQLESVKKQLYKEIQQAWYNALGAQQKYESSLQAEASAAESFALVQARYENGKATITEFNESKNQYLKAGSDRVQACYESLYQSALLDFYEGKEIKL